MKKSSLAFATIDALVLSFASCKKESDTLTFSAHSEASADKTSLNSSNDLEWESTDKVEIYNSSAHATFSVAPRTDNATWADLSGDNIGEAPYSAIYPASISTSSADAVVLPQYQVSVDGRLSNFPMKATLQNSITSDNHTFHFTNLCAAIRIRLPEGAAKLQRIDLATDQPITGSCSIGTYSDGKPYAIAANGSTKEVSLEVSQPQNNTTNEYYITLPANEYHSFTIRMYTAGGQLFNKTINQTITLQRNTITTFQFSNSTIAFSDPLIARLKESAFGGNDNITKIVFHYNSDVQSTTQLKNTNADVESADIFGVREGNVYHVHTPADFILAPVNSNNLFSFGNRTLQNIEFGRYFRTDETTSMNSMFYANENLTSLDLSTFNTENVTDMGKLFEGCQNLSQLNLTNFSSQSLEEMYNIFYYCRRLTSIELNSSFTAPDRISTDANELGLSRACDFLGDLAGGCTIHCNNLTKERLRAYGWVNDNTVHFNTDY
ncbi:MAG: DUF285 domain-containing protein [Bacteroidales bacterium]|nr:DUF285 domain-containing protein [Bacteroidales bacterium]